MCFPFSTDARNIHQDIFYLALQTVRAQIIDSLLLAIPRQADPNPCVKLIGGQFVYLHICWDATETEAAGENTRLE